MKSRFFTVALSILTVSTQAQAAGESGSLAGHASVVVHAAGQKNLESAQIFVDNEQAYRSKLELIKSAKKSIRLAYYIYADDESSSYMTQLLINKAKENVKIDILVDLNTNYGRMDLFRMMEEQGGKDSQGQPNLRVRFYNRPTPSLIRDITFMTSGCAPEKQADQVACRAERKALADWALREAETALKDKRSPNLPLMTRLFLAGLYSKDGAALQASLAAGTGSDLMEVIAAIKAKKAQTSSDDADVEQLKGLLKLLFEAKVKGSLQAKMQLALALGVYGAQIQPIIDLMDKAIPDTFKDSLANEDDWIHVTDFLHHKFLLVDDQYLQLGGRNIENSYHLNKKAGENGKYVFRDTDFRVTLQRPEPMLSLSYDRMFNFREMIISTGEIQNEFKYEYIAQLGTLVTNLQKCIASGQKDCANTVAQTLENQEPKRKEQARQEMVTLANSKIVHEVLSSNARRFSHFNEKLNPQELAEASLVYLENLPYDKNVPGIPNKRLYFQDFKIQASEETKHIHLAVIESIKRTCTAAASAYSKASDKAAYLANPANKKRITIHQGYTIFSGELLEVLGQAVNEKSVTGGSDVLHCPNVEIEILTNSIQTTDLSVINLFAGLQVGSLVDIQKRSLSTYNSVQDNLVKNRMFPPATIRYFELQPSKSGDTESLHTKVFAFDTGLFIGSANADVRSYYMDSNNGLFLTGVPGISREYFQWVDSQKKNDGSGQPYFLELTNEMQKAASTLNGIQASDSKARLEALKAFFAIEAGKVAEHYEKKWQGQLAHAKTPEEKAKIEARIEKLRKALPGFVSAIAAVNLYVFDVSQDIILQEKQKSEIKDIIRAFNLRFEVL